jgi:hypothetical protein
VATLALCLVDVADAQRDASVIIGTSVDVQAAYSPSPFAIAMNWLSGSFMQPSVIGSREQGVPS